jgi:SsrA-binding protein
MAKKTKKTAPNTIALNRKASHDYSFETVYEAGIMLQGWEIKSIRQGRVNLQDSYVTMRQGEAYLLGCHISPLLSASTHITADPTRTKKLLLNSSELKKLMGGVQRDGYSIVVTALYWKKQLVKVKIALAKGKKEYDKRASQKERDWSRNKDRILKER